jgi:hypothetical protein
MNLGVRPLPSLVLQANRSFHLYSFIPSFSFLFPFSWHPWPSKLLSQFASCWWMRNDRFKHLEMSFTVSAFTKRANIQCNAVLHELLKRTRKSHHLTQRSSPSCKDQLLQLFSVLMSRASLVFNQNKNLQKKPYPGKL